MLCGVGGMGVGVGPEVRLMAEALIPVGGRGGEPLVR